jgi:hypothetical protein
MKKGILRRIHSLIVGLFIAGATQVFAGYVDVYWSSYFGFSTTAVTINAGDTVYVVNYDDPDYGWYVAITGDSPEYFYAYLQPGYYTSHVYNNPGTFTFSDDFWEETVYVTVNAAVPLAVAITDPTNNAAFTAPATFPITAVPSGGAGYYDVEFFVGTNSIGDVFDPPYTSTATNLPAGTYTLTAIVTDYNYDRATNAITVTVSGAPAIVLNTPRIAGNQFLFNVAGLTVGKTNVVQYRTNLSAGTWTSAATNVATSSSMTVTNALGVGLRIYRVFQSP